MELDQDSFADRVDSVLSTPDPVVSDPNLAALTSPSFNSSSLSHSLPRTSNLDLLARSVHPLSSNRTEPLLEGPQHKDRQSFYSHPAPFTSNGLPLVTSTSASTLIDSAHASLHDSHVGSYDLPSRSTAGVYQQHSMDTSPSFQQKTHQNFYFPSSFSSSSFTEQVESDLQSRGQFSSYASQSANPADWRGESLSAAERVKLMGRQQSEHVSNTDKGGSIVKRDSDDSLVQVGVEGREEDDEELEPADSDVDMDCMENGHEPEKKKKKWNKAPQSGKNWRSGLKRAPDGSWEVPPESAVKKADQSSDPLHSPSSVLSLTDSALTAEPSSTLTSTSNYKKPKLKAKPKPGQAIVSSNDSEAVSSLKKKVSRKKKQPAGTNSQGPTRSPSPVSGLPNDQPTPTVSSSRARSYSQSVDPEGALEEEGYIEVTGRKSTKRRRIDEKEKEKEREREREMEELLRRQRDEEDEESEDDQLYCVCNSRYDAESPMIACDMCAEWYHPKCVEIPEEEIELVDLFVCPKCHEETAEKTTWRTKCRSAECFKPAVPPLTKYCSTACGTAHLTALLETKDIDLSRHWNQVERAQRPSGVVIVNPDFPTSHPFTTTSSLASDTPINPTQSPAPIKLGNTGLTSLDLSDHPATRHLHVMDGSLKTSIDKVQNQLSLLSNRLTLLSFASNRADMMPSVASLSLKDDPVVSPERPSSGSKRGPQKKSSAGAGVGGSGQGDRPCGFDRRLILDEQDFGKYVDSEEGRVLFAPPLEDDISDSRLKKEGENESPVDPGFETYLRAGEKDLERKQKMMSETDMEVDGSTGSDGHQHVKSRMEDTWCYRSKKKCEGHRGWQKIRLIDFQLEQSSKRNTLGLLERTRSILQQDIQIAEKRIRRAMGEPEIKPENKVETEIKTGISTAVLDRSSSYREEKDGLVVTPSLAATATAADTTAAIVVTEDTGIIAVNGGVGLISNSITQVDLPIIS